MAKPTTQAAEAGRGVILVTGASGGVGEAVVREFSKESGTLLWLTGRREEALRELADEIEAGGHGPVRYAVGDLTSAGFCAQLSEAVQASSPGLDVLIHAAGVYSSTGLIELTRPEYERVFDLNVFARCELTARLLPLLQARRGLVVFVNSSVATRRGAAPGLYAMSMHAARTAADALRAEMNTFGIRVMSVFLGRTATPMQRQLAEMEGALYEPARLIQPRTVAQAILSLCRLPPDAEFTDLSIRPTLPPRAP